MKRLMLLAAIAVLSISCKEKQGENSNPKLQVYNLTLYKDKFNSKTNTFLPNDSVFMVKSTNDTTAYLLALNTFYNEKIKERALFNYGQPNGFLIIDKDKINLSLKLNERLVNGLEVQVKHMPEIKKMIDEYNRDSLKVN